MWLHLIQNTREFIITLSVLFCASLVAFLCTLNFVIGILTCCLSIILLLFGVLFRKPNRSTRDDYKHGSHIIGHMDGYVSKIEEIMIENKRYSVIEITGDIFSINANFFPITGVISEIELSDIKVLGAKNKKHARESRAYRIKTENDDEIIFTKDAGEKGQIVSSTHEFVGAELSAGDPFGFMKSTNSGRIYVPLSRFLIKITPGDRIVAGSTLVALRIL